MYQYLLQFFFVKRVVMVKVIQFIQICLEVCCAFLACKCLNADNWKSEGQASPQQYIFVLSPLQTMHITMLSKSLYFSPKDFWHRLHCLFWHMKTKYFILIALSPNTFLKTPQQTASVRVNTCISSLLTDHSAIHYAVAFLKNFLSSASFQMAIKRVTTVWWKIPSIWILSLFPI